MSTRFVGENEYDQAIAQCPTTTPLVRAFMYPSIHPDPMTITRTPVGKIKNEQSIAHCPSMLPFV